jgi:hypothetical protein
VIGLVFAFFGAEQVQLIETQLQTRLPAGSDIAAFVLTVLCGRRRSLASTCASREPWVVKSGMRIPATGARPVGF